MPKSPQFQKIYDDFVKRYGEEKGKSFYFAWIKKNKLDDTKAMPEKREFSMSPVRGVEIREVAGEYYICGIATGSPLNKWNDITPKETLEDFAQQANNNPQIAGIMGIHHSEGRTGEYGGVADPVRFPAQVVPLPDRPNEWGLAVATKIIPGDTMGEQLVQGFQTGEYTHFSITFDTQGGQTCDYHINEDGDVIRTVLPGTKLLGWTATTEDLAANTEAVAAIDIREFRELFTFTTPVETNTKPGSEKTQEANTMTSEETTNPAPVAEDVVTAAAPVAQAASPTAPVEQPAAAAEDTELREFRSWKSQKEERERQNNVAEKKLREEMSKMEATEVREKVLQQEATQGAAKEVSVEMREFIDVLKRPQEIESREQFRRAGAVTSNEMFYKGTSRAEEREYKHFGVNGRRLEFRGLGLTTNQNSDTDYLQSAAELNDVYDPVIYNALNQATVTWNVLAKDDYSKKGNNQVQFTLKTAANTSAAFYTGNAVTTANVTRLKYQTKFKKLQVGISVDGDMIAAARGGPIGDVFAQEVMDSTMDMLAVLNAALYAEKGLETAPEIIGFEYLADSAGNTTLYNVTRSAANKLAPDSAGDTYINGASALITEGNLRAAKRQCLNEGSAKSNLCFFTSPLQGDLLRTKMSDERRLQSSRDTDFGFSTDLFFDGIPVFEDKDVTTDNWFCVDLSTHRVAIWVPPTVEKLGKTGDSEDAFIKMYLATYNRAPRRIAMIYDNATS